MVRDLEPAKPYQNWTLEMLQITDEIRAQNDIDFEKKARR